MKKHNYLKVALWVIPIIILCFAIFARDQKWAYVVNLVLAFIESGILLYRFKDENNALKVVLATMLCFVLLSWIIPAAVFSSEYIDQGRVQVGLFDVFNYSLTSLSYFGYIGFFFLLVGGFYGILYKIPAYRSFLDKIVAGAKGKEKVVLGIMVVVISLLVSICGLQIGYALFIPLVVAIILLMGYDKIVAALVIVGSMIAGLAGATYASSNTSYLVQSFGLNNDYEIGVRFIILLVGVALVIFNTLMYIKNVKPAVAKKTVKKVADKKKTSKNSKAAAKEEVIVVKEEKDSSEFVPASVSKKHKVWPFVVTFALLFILMVLAFIPWGETGFGIKLFDDVTTNVQGYELFGFPIFAKLLGTINSFGNWTITDLLFPMALVIALLMILYKVNFNDMLDGFVSGVKKALAPAAIVLAVYTILVLVTYHPYQLTLYNVILGEKFNIARTALAAILSGVFNSDMHYAFQSIIPYYSQTIVKTNASLSAILFQSMYGWSMLVAPTSLILMGTLAYLKVSYRDWLKAVWKLLLELFVILLIVLLILAMI